MGYLFLLYSPYIFGKFLKDLGSDYNKSQKNKNKSKATKEFVTDRLSLINLIEIYDQVEELNIKTNKLIGE